MDPKKKGASIISPDDPDVEVVERRDEYVAYVQLLLSIANRARPVDPRVSIICNTVAATIGAVVDNLDEKDITQLAKICQAFAKKKQRELLKKITNIQ